MRSYPKYTGTKTTGRTAFLQLLADEGVTHLFGNPGTTELAIMEVVPDFPQLRFVLGLQESVVLGMADGFCRASGRLAAANVHDLPGHPVFPGIIGLHDHTFYTTAFGRSVQLNFSAPRLYLGSGVIGVWTRNPARLARRSKDRSTGPVSPTRRSGSGSTPL